MDYDKSDIARNYDEARALTPDRLHQGGHACIRNTTRDCEFVYRHFFPLQPLIDSDLPAREDITCVFVAAGFAATAHQIVSQLVASDWPSFVQYSALRGDSFLARLS